MNLTEEDEEDEFQESDISEVQPTISNNNLYNQQISVNKNTH